jgi:hypothetical protein
MAVFRIDSENNIAPHASATADSENVQVFAHKVRPAVAFLAGYLAPSCGKPSAEVMRRPRSQNQFMSFLPPVGLVRPL